MATKTKQQPEKKWSKPQREKLTAQLRVSLTDDDASKLEALCDEHCVSNLELLRMLIRKEYKAVIG
jgi:hypothetical protein